MKKIIVILHTAMSLILAIMPTRGGEADVTSDPAIGPFGIGSSSSSSHILDKWIPQMAKIGIKTLRDPGGTGWVRKDRASWDELDKKLDYLDTQGFLTGATLYNYGRPGGFPLDDLSGWSKDVAGMVGHETGRIKYWEVWNEPPNGTQESPGSDYAKLLVASYDAAKSANPHCMIGMAAKSVDINYLDQAIKAGAKDHFDYITLHPYETFGCAMDHAGAEAVYMSIVPTVRKMLAAQDPAKSNCPIWFTEIGCDAGQGADRQGNALVKVYAMGIAQGVSCINWFEGMDGDSGPMGILQADGTPRPSYQALTQMIQYLGQHPVYLGWVLLNEKDYGFVFQGVKGTVMVTWAPKGMTDNLNFGQSTSIVEPLTGNAAQANTYALTEAPIMVIGVPNDLVSKARDNKAKPFPWGGDYTDAKSVSVTFGENNIEKGLHTQSAASIASDVILYGGSARAGSIPGGNIFMVDPNFLSYTSTPIEITVVVRRNPANDNAGFAVKYESTNGTKSCGWYTVPDNKEWHTQTWKVTDAQFVSMYGFNFALDSDGDQFNKYDIQSVTVTKLDK